MSQPPLNFPTPDLNNSDTLTYTQAGITWTWNNTLGVWSSDLEGGVDGVDSLWEENSGKLYPKTLTNKVGIGTANPATALHISGTGVSDSRLTVNRSGSEGVVGVTGNDLLLAGTGSDGSNGGINFYTGGSSSAVIDSSGNANFAGRTTHEAGIVSSGTTNGGNGVYSNLPATGEAIINGFRAGVQPGVDLGSSEYRGFFINQGTGVSTGNVWAFYSEGNAPSFFQGQTQHAGCVRVVPAQSSYTDANNNALVNAQVASDFSATTLYGYRANVRASNATNAYSFYAAGDAPNYFAGFSTFNSGIASLGGSRFRGGATFENSQGATTKEASLTWQRANDLVKGSIGTGGIDGENALFIQADTNHPLLLGTNDTPWVRIEKGGGVQFDGAYIKIGSNDPTGTRLGNDGNVGISRSGSNSNPPGISLRRTNNSATTSWIGIEFFKGSDTSRCGFVRLNGASTRTIDTRLGATGVAMADGAADIVKLLQPKVISQGGETFSGFLPADLAGTFDEAVDGTPDATVSIGTYTDAEGVAQTDVEEPEAIPFGATWEQTGIKDVMQGVCP